MKKKKTPFYDTFTLNGQALDPEQAGEGPRDMVMRVLKHSPHPLRLDDILRIGGISRRLKREVLDTLQSLADEGKLMRINGGAWVSAESLKTVSGVLALQRSGAAFLVPSVGAKPFPKGDIFIGPDSIGQAWNGDTVEVVLLPGQSGPSPEGRVLRVLERGQSEITVRVVRPERKSEVEPGDVRRVLCRPADPRLTFDMLVDITALATAKEVQQDELLRVTVGQLLPSSPDSPLWSGTALRSLGMEDDVTVQEQLVKLNHMIPTSFPDDVLAEAQAVAAGESTDLDGMAAKLEDVRTMPLVTIDGADARDFDDAVFVESHGKGWRLVVAIADVSYFVRPRSRLDKEALARGNSYYFPTSVEPMLPEALSNGVCSLRPHEDRRVMVADMVLDASGALNESRFYNARMRSQARLTYEQAQTMMDGGPHEFGQDITAMLAKAKQLAEVLILRRAKRGGLDFDIPEAEFTTTDGRVTGLRHRQRLFSHRLIEAFMVCANEATAEFLSKKDAPLLFRVHPEPGPEKLENLLRGLRAVSLPLPLPSLSAVAGKAPSYKSGNEKQRKKPESSSTVSSAKNISQWLPAVLQAAADTPQSYIVGRLALRSMMQARYSPEKEGHFGLASESYSHFTSPIRRYADLVTHRALKHALGLDTGGAIPTGQKLFEVAEHCNSHERTAQDAEREIARRLGCLLLRDRVGEDFHGIISGVTNFGLFVELDGLPMEGMIKIETLGNDYYEYNPDRQELRGKSTSEAWRLGEEIDVRLVEVNIGRLEITLVVAGSPEGGSERRGFRKSPGGASARPSRYPTREGGQKRNSRPGAEGQRDRKSGHEGGKKHGMSGSNNRGGRSR